MKMRDGKYFYDLEGSIRLRTFPEYLETIPRIGVVRAESLIRSAMVHGVLAENAHESGAPSILPESEWQCLLLHEPEVSVAEFELNRMDKISAACVSNPIEVRKLWARVVRKLEEQRRQELEKNPDEPWPLSAKSIVDALPRRYRGYALITIERAYYGIVRTMLKTYGLLEEVMYDHEGLFELALEKGWYRKDLARLLTELDGDDETLN